MGATLFKQSSPYAEHWYPLLKPWENMIPVKETLEDLPEKAKWAQEHPAEAQKNCGEGKEARRGTPHTRCAPLLCVLPHAGACEAPGFCPEEVRS
mmetsp:Transcript_24920/g.67302  ORF Transcript_24920/g.67302 Transcript_24920/m.67302 type:complete len:95 (-) Transcript_24920:403-687(-)